MGMDSLMAVELSNRLKALLGQTLPTTLAFEYPTIHAIADYLEQNVLSTAMRQEHTIEKARPLIEFLEEVMSPEIRSTFWMRKLRLRSGRVE